MVDLDEIMEHVALAIRVLFEMGLANASTIERGHVSLRVPGVPNHFVIKALGPALSMTRKEPWWSSTPRASKWGGPAN